jgi:flap endonuclease-1
MGIAFKDLIPNKEITLEELSGKTLVFDSYNLLYQFLSSIRSRDGSLLMDSQGNITSHLVGLFSRITNLMSYNIKMVFVFDGKAPELKDQEREKRKILKIEAQKEYEKAKEAEDIASMKKYASRTSILSKSMIEDAKSLLQYLGLPVVQAPSEGEAQAAYIVKKENFFGVVSQDYDSLLYSTPNLIRNLSIAGKRKQTDKLSYVTINPEIINLKEALSSLSINQDQLLAMALLIGTDYNPGGIKGIGPKNALKLVQKYDKDYESIFKEARWHENIKTPWKDIINLFKQMPVTDDYKLEWKNIDEKNLTKFLSAHDFSEERINTTLEKLKKGEETRKQKSLFEF